MSVLGAAVLVVGSEPGFSISDPISIHLARAVSPASPRSFSLRSRCVSRVISRCLKSGRVAFFCCAFEAGV